MNGYLLILSCIGAYFVNLSVQDTPPLSADCQALKDCTTALEANTWFYKGLTAYPSSEQVWRTQWTQKCTARQNKIACTQDSACQNQLLRKAARLARKQARFMCQSEGRKYFRHMYSNGQGTCLGDSAKVAQWKTNHDSCKATFRQNLADGVNTCTALNTARSCDSDYAASICTDISRFPLDRGWYAFTEVYFHHCLSSFSPARYELP